MDQTNVLIAYTLIPCSQTLEVQDSKHRYGKMLIPYHEEWKASNSNSTFFDWLDSSESARVHNSPSFQARENAKPRKELEEAIVKYCTPEEAANYSVVCRVSSTSGYRLVWAGGNPPDDARTGDPVHTDNVHLVEDNKKKWIFVIDQQGDLFVGEKVKRRFHHSSFVAGESVRCAGRILVDHGIVRMIMPYSGHYPTSMEVLEEATTMFFGEKMPLSDPEKILCR